MRDAKWPTGVEIAVLIALVNYKNGIERATSGIIAQILDKDQTHIATSLGNLEKMKLTEGLPVVGGRGRAWAATPLGHSLAKMAQSIRERL